MLIVTQTNQDKDHMEMFPQGPVRCFTNTAPVKLAELTQLLINTALQLSLEVLDEAQVADQEQWGGNSLASMFCSSPDGYYVHLVIYKLPNI